MLPLQRMKVVDLTQYLAGPYCSMVLADLGADVIKVEKFPEGDDSRRLGPFFNGEGLCFAMPNRNKRSIALDLKSEKGKEIFLRLAKEADVIMENFRPGVVKKLGIDYDAVKEINPSIIYCSISGYGQTGPYSHKGGFDIIAQGMAGFMLMTGDGKKPTKMGIAVNDIAGGATALYGILAAYIHKLQTGQGQYLDTSILEAGLAWTFWESAAYFGHGELPAATGARHRRSTPYQAYKTKDGYVTIGAGNQRLWERLCTDVLQRPEWITDPRFAKLDDRMKNVDVLEQLIEEVLAEHPTDYWVQKLEDAGVPGGPVYRYDQALSDPHVLARDMVITTKHPRIGEYRTIGFPVKFSKTPLSIRKHAPWLGEHTTEVLRETGYSDEEIEEMYESGIVYDKYKDERVKK